MVRAGRNPSGPSRRKRNRSAGRFRHPRSARHAAHLLESRPGTPSLPDDHDPQRLQPDPGNPCPERADPGLPAATLSQARLRANLRYGPPLSPQRRGAPQVSAVREDWVLPAKSLSAVGVAHARIPTSLFIPVLYGPIRNFSRPRGFHECNKDLRGSPDAIPILFILKDAISKVLRFTRHLSRYWSFLSFQRASPARHLRRRNWRPCLLRPRASLRLRVLRLLSLRLRTLRLLRA